uniref:Uncharacterized protein n=1 Tax=Timema douglasi TaxID=61478 RepID=A0A7R8VKE5_TIMDO|nr:unnamed protein product [Timema douglasi]
MDDVVGLALFRGGGEGGVGYDWLHFPRKPVGATSPGDSGFDPAPSYFPRRFPPLFPSSYWQNPPFTRRANDASVEWVGEERQIEDKRGRYFWAGCPNLRKKKGGGSKISDHSRPQKRFVSNEESLVEELSSLKKLAV